MTPAVAQEEDGAQLYQDHCASCHQPDGSGVPGAFPPLAGNPNVTDPSYVADVIQNGLSGPIDVLGETYDASMPAITSLSPAQIEAVSAYVVNLAGQGEAPATTVPSGPIEGDAVHGELLFIGSERLSAGGAACVSCHAAGSYSQGGAGLGPDLTAVAARLGGAGGLTAWLADPPSVTMQPVFADRPLSDSEIADLTAYFTGLEGDTAAGTDWFIVLGLGGLLVLVGVTALFARRSRQSYVDRLRSKT